MILADRSVHGWGDYLANTGADGAAEISAFKTALYRHFRARGREIRSLGVQSCEDGVQCSITFYVNPHVYRGGLYHARSTMTTL